MCRSLNLSYNRVSINRIPDGFDVCSANECFNDNKPTKFSRPDTFMIKYNRSHQSSQSWGLVIKIL
jgi:hypothetical protein